MSLVPELEFGWNTAWWFTAAFGLTNLVLISVSPRGFAARLFRLPGFETFRERAISMVSIFVFARALMIYTVFVPLRLYSVWFGFGCAIFVGGLIFHSAAMVGFANTAPGKPVVTGAYSFTRHPMQLTAIVMWTGVGVATLSGVICLACFLQLFLSRPFLLAQERMCLEAYGDEYRQYMRNTPRYFNPFR